MKSYSGTFNSPLAKHLAVGTKVKVRVVNYAYPSAYTTKYVIPAKPVVSKINVNNIAIKGKATKGSMVYVKIYGKTYSGKASTSTGAFSIKVPKVLVEAAVQVYCKISGYKSQTVYINV